jgi:hypothetical protein
MEDEVPAFDEQVRVSGASGTDGLIAPLLISEVRDIPMMF